MTAASLNQNKLTPAQYTGLNNFTALPYVTEYGTWYNEQHQQMANDNMNIATLRRLKAHGYIQRVNVGYRVFYHITSTGIAAHDAYAVKRGDHDFAAVKEQASVRRAATDAARAAKQIEITEDNIFMAGNASIITARFSQVQSHPEEHIKISTDLYANEIDDMIALLTAAKRELARRKDAAR